jgi:hypothetical protein
MEKGFVIDFTGKTFKKYDRNVINYLLKLKPKTLVKFIDYIQPIKPGLYPIKDHINLSGFNPLTGPSFISLTNIHRSKKGIIVVALPKYVEPNEKEKKKLINIGITAISYNLVPAAILAAALNLKIKAYGILK